MNRFGTQYQSTNPFLAQSGVYRFGFNGKEVEYSISESRRTYDTDFRFYDPTIGRWLSLDPIMCLLAGESPFSSFLNSPLFIIDPTGLTPEETNGESIVLKGQGEAVADMTRTSAMLPASAEDGQEVRFEYQAIANETYGIQEVSYTYYEQSGKWSMTFYYQQSDHACQGARWHDNSISGDPNVELPRNDLTPNLDKSTQSTPTISVSNSVKTQQTANASHTRVTSNPTADAVSKTTEIGGLAPQVFQASVNDMATPPRYSSADVPDLKSWTPWARGFKRAGTIFNYVGRAFGIVSAGNNLIGFINKARGGDPKGALISLGKGAIDLVFLAVKATPFGILAGVGWAVISSYIGD